MPSCGNRTQKHKLWILSLLMMGAIIPRVNAQELSSVKNAPEVTSTYPVQPSSWQQPAPFSWQTPTDNNDMNPSMIEKVSTWIKNLWQAAGRQLGQLSDTAQNYWHTASHWMHQKLPWLTWSAVTTSSPKSYNPDPERPDQHTKGFILAMARDNAVRSHSTQTDEKDQGIHVHIHPGGPAGPAYFNDQSTIGLHQHTITTPPLEAQTLSTKDYKVDSLLPDTSIRTHQKKKRLTSTQFLHKVETCLEKTMQQAGHLPREGGKDAIGICEKSGGSRFVIAQAFGYGKLMKKTKTPVALTNALDQECREHKAELISVFVPL